MAKEKVVKDNAERWLLTYSDLMNLLLILFIIMFAMSRVDAAKFDKLADSLKAAFGTSSSDSFLTSGGGGNSLVSLPGTASAVIPASLEQQQMDAVKDKVEQLVDKQNLKGEVNVTNEERGVVISITAKMLFKSGSAYLEPDAKPTIWEIGQMLRSISANQIRVEGHTDNDPIYGSAFSSNWELSSARATNVLRLLVDQAGIEPSHISAVGYGEFRPKVKNDTEEHKAENRRVDIVVIKSKFDKAEAGSVDKPSN